MEIIVLTLFDKLFKNFLKESIIKREIKEKLVSMKIIYFRKFSKFPRQKVDNYQYGCGGGMIIALQPIVDAIKKYNTKSSVVILLSPQGKVFNQKEAIKYSKYKRIILVCGRYEGFDERIINYVDMIVSIGDFILMGGEVAAMTVIETCVRLLDNVISQKSLVSESFNGYLLDYPVFTKPVNYEGHVVPDVLLSGNHTKIGKYRLNQRIKKTKSMRPDLYAKYLRR
jgi:tRNA (guanine37-N1)-methyltransferase